MDRSEPLAGIGSIRTRLAVLVGVSVVVAALVGSLGTDVGAPLWLTIPATIGLALLITRWLASGMTTPLRQMTAAASRMAGGDYDVRIATTSSDEIASLARAFERMAGDLATADEHRRRLVATVAHELRTPLTAQRALLENLVDGVIAPDDAALQQALHQSERLSGLVTDLLDLSRDDGRGAPVRPAQVRVRDLLDRAVGEADLQGRQVTVTARVEPQDLTVTADPGRLHQVLANLVDNALRHSPGGGTVELVAERTDAHRWQLTVADEGPGLSPERADRLFSRFGAGASGDGGGGTGLGLAIAGWVAGMHHGTITALPQDDGTAGARLRMTPPVAPPFARPSRTTLQHQAPTVTTPSPPAPTTPTAPPPTPSTALARPLTTIRGWWPEHDDRPQPRALGAALGVGLLAALLLPEHTPGLGLLVVLVAGGLSLWAASPRRTHALSFVTAALAIPLALTTILRADFGYAVPALMTAALLTVLACTGARSLTGIAASALAWPASALRGLPLLDRTLRAMTRGGQLASTLRMGAVSLVLLLVFGGLLASSDAVLGSWVDAVVPDIGDATVFRVFTFVFFAGVTLAGLYLAINPPAVEHLELSDHVSHRVPAREWQVPLLVVVGVFVAWLVAQAASLLGGHDYVLRTTGVTYAESARQGFGQLVVVTVLTLALVTGVRTYGLAQTRRDERLRTGLLAALCVLALLVVGSALRRMALYQQAYGWTEARVVGTVGELWLGLVVLAVLTSLFTGWRRLGRVVVLTGAAAVLVLTVGNTSGFVAERNIARYEATGKIDIGYLGSVGPDAAPTIHASSLPAAAKECALAGRHDHDDALLAWNLGRERAHEVYRQYPAAPRSLECSGTRWE